MFKQTTDEELMQLIADCRAEKRRAQHRFFKLFYSEVMAVCMRYAKDEDEAVMLLEQVIPCDFEVIRKSVVVVGEPRHLVQQNNRLFPVADTPVKTPECVRPVGRGSALGPSLIRQLLGECREFVGVRESGRGTLPLDFYEAAALLLGEFLYERAFPNPPPPTTCHERGDALPKEHGQLINLVLPSEKHGALLSLPSQKSLR